MGPFERMGFSVQHSYALSSHRRIERERSESLAYMLVTIAGLIGFATGIVSLYSSPPEVGTNTSRSSYSTYESRDGLERGINLGDPKRALITILLGAVHD